jgi:hypothetical protein
VASPGSSDEPVATAAKPTPGRTYTAEERVRIIAAADAQRQQANLDDAHDELARRLP